MMAHDFTEGKGERQGHHFKTVRLLGQEIRDKAEPAIHMQDM